MKKLLLLLIIPLFFYSCEAPKKPDLKALREKHRADSILYAEQNKIDIEKARILKENSLGIWRTGFYVDEFGEPTKQGFIGTDGLILGNFSNSATENSRLTVKFLISNSKDISIQLYEYAGNNPVKEGVDHGYRIRVKQDTLSPVDLYASNYSDRLSLDEKNSKILNEVLLKGGNLKFSIIEVSDYTQSKYFFEIQDASGYKNALKQLSGQNKK